MNPLWMLRLSRWARHLPSGKRVWLILGVVAITLAIAGVERLAGGSERIERGGVPTVQAPRP